MRRLLLVLAMLVASPGRTHADGDGALERAARLLMLIELGIPDARFERSFTTDDHRLALSWPIVMRANHVELGSTSGLVFNHVLELQYEVTRGELRALLGERMLVHGADRSAGPLPFIEIAGLLGSDGHGGVFGGGLAYGDGQFGVSLGVVVRFVVTTEERRGDVAIDLQFPFNVL